LLFFNELKIGINLVIYTVQSVIMKNSTTLKNIFSLLLASVVANMLNAQSVSEIITDYNGYYKSGIGAINPTKPDNSHNLLAFSFNGTRYSTGVNDALLTSRNDVFTAGLFRAMPMNNLTGVANSSTKIGLGYMADGVANGPGAVPPSRNLSQYLVDGPNGLDLGTCVANLPAGTMFMSVTNLQATNIGDGVPDILVTQTADPSSKYDRYCFTDINGNMVGNYVDINLTNISSVGTWTADFYEATGSTILAPGYTATQRNIRLWAADFSMFGINASNISSIAYFKIVLSGDSDIAFVAYNTKTVSVNQILALPSNTTRLTRTTAEEVKSLKVFPNPASSSVNFIHPVAKGEEKIAIYSMSGALVMQYAVNANTTQTKLNISSLRTGAYQVVYGNGTVKFSEKLIVQ
jgi:hypothetical protein